MAGFENFLVRYGTKFGWDSVPDEVLEPYFQEVKEKWARQAAEYRAKNPLPETPQQTASRVEGKLRQGLPSTRSAQS